jgi:hypothetical protein
VIDLMDDLLISFGVACESTSRVTHAAGLRGMDIQCDRAEHSPFRMPRCGARPSDDTEAD